MGNPARELAAIEAVTARASTLTHWVALLVIVPSVLACVAVYFVVRELQFEFIGVNIVYLSCAVAVVTTVAPGIAIARAVSGFAVRRRRPAWIAQAAAEQSVPVESIAEAFGDWN